MKAVLITGTSTGIGRTTALHLDKLGYTVFASLRKEEDGKSLQKEASSNLRPVIIDMNNGDSIEKAFELISQSVGSNGLVGVVNNAGTHMGGPLEFFDLDHIRKGFEVNLLGPIHIVQDLFVAQMGVPIPLATVQTGHNHHYSLPLATPVQLSDYVEYK